MTTFVEPKTTLEYLAYLGFESPERGGITAALKVTRARKRRRRPGRVERNVVLCYVLGASHSGKVRSFSEPSDNVLIPPSELPPRRFSEPTVQSDISSND